MAINRPGAVKPSLENLPQAKVKVSFILLLAAFGLVTVLTPNLKALDSNGPKFLALALLNLGVFVYLFSSRKSLMKASGFTAFFSNGIGLAYASLIAVSLLSFFKAINVLESVLHFTKIFATFTSAYLVSILVMQDKRNVLYLCAAMSLLLIYDSFSVFFEIRRFITGEIADVRNIKSIYSNKNILASSIFVKIPFALWLMIFSRKWMRALGIAGTFLAITATFFLSARAFYVGLIALTFVLIFVFGIRFRQSHQKLQLKLAGTYLVLLLSAFLIFSLTQSLLYPKTGSQYTRSVGERLASITAPGGHGRVEGWKRSWNVFKKEPLLGVGLGN